MTSPEDAAPVKPPPSVAPGAPAAAKARYSDKIQSPKLLATALSETSISSAAAGLVSPTSSTSASRSSSPNGRISYSSLARSSTGSPLAAQIFGSDDIRTLIIRAFAPTVAVYASADTEDLVKGKGFKNGFHQLLRPFGENVQGKVVIRDSNGSSRGWEDFGVRFVGLGASGPELSSGESKQQTPTLKLEESVSRLLDSAEEPLGSWVRPGNSGHTALASPLYKVFLRRLLSSATSTPHETFAHPVACVIAISSRTPSPLEHLRQLYSHTSQGDKRPPEWVHPEYLRYYVLVHDEDHDDITQSNALFDQMKRHFGLHCHLLRLRSGQCVFTDDDSVQVPACEWVSASEALATMSDGDALLEAESAPQCIFESDMASVKTMVREMVVQSVIPYMENRVALWNDQVASRRRGLSGRFMSISRRWAGFGSSSRTSGSATGGSSGNYDTELGFYISDSPEAILRKMADFAFMLRDWKLSSSTYELLRTDFGNDKAWRHHAGANEMCAISTLLNPLATSVKIKLDTIDQMLETACYSYLTRCSDTQNALRSLTLGVELLKSRGGLATETAAKWAMRIMDMGLVGNIGVILIGERVSACYASKTGTGAGKWGSRRRKAAMWSVTAAESWLRLGKPALASACLEEADRLYNEVLEQEGVFPMPEMQSFIDGLRRAVRVEFLEARGIDVDTGTAEAEQLGTEETSEKLDRRNHRKSLIGPPNPLEAGPLSPSRHDRNGDSAPDDDFE